MEDPRPPPPDTPAAHLLVDPPAPLPRLSLSPLGHHSAEPVDADLFRVLELHRDFRWVGAGRYDPVVLDAALIPVVDEVDSRVETGVTGLFEIRQAHMPFPWVIADEVVGDRSLRFLAVDR